MAVYTVLENHESKRNLRLRDWFPIDNESNNDKCGGRIYAESTNWPFRSPSKGISEGGIGALDVENNQDDETLMVTGLIYCSAVMYIYMNDDRVSAVMAFHSPSGTLNIKSGNRAGGKFGGPIAEAKLHGHTVKPGQVFVIIGAGPDTMAAYSRPVGVNPYYNKMAKHEHQSILSLLKEEKIDKRNIIIYCSSNGMFGISEEGYIGEPRFPPSAYVPPPKKKRCYLATATCVSLGLPDDCEELNLLRWYRDDILLKTPSGRRDVDLYYQTAPQIVEKIDSFPNAELIYREIYCKYLSHAICAIRCADYQRAYGVYRDLVWALKVRFM